MANWRLDMRIPVVFGAAPEPADAVLAEDGAPVPAGFHVIRFRLADQTGHPAGCACCAPRAPVAEALARAFRDRATGASPFFTRVTAIPSSAAVEDAVRTALVEDAFTASRFRQNF